MNLTAHSKNDNKFATITIIKRLIFKWDFEILFFRFQFLIIILLRIVFVFNILFAESKNLKI